MWRWVAAWELAYNRHEDGLMADERWEAWDRSFKFLILDPKIGFAEELWNFERGSYGLGFMAHVDAAYSKRKQD